jgi:hypothetical protein
MRMLRAIFLLPLLLTPVLQAAVIHVSPAGKESSPGTAELPVATLERARDLLRQVPAGEAREIRVEAGTHFLPRVLELDKRDNGLSINGTQGAVLSGGRAITGWTKAEGKLWKAPVPPGCREAQLFRAGEAAQVLARTPDFDPARPYTGGWLFVDKPARGTGRPDAGIGGIHTPGDWVEWEVQVETAGLYHLWMRYAGDNKQYFPNEADFRGRMQMQVNGGPPVILEDVPDTGAWGNYQWHRTGGLQLQTGLNTLRWTNLKGGGLNWDSFVLAQGANWSRDIPGPLPAIYVETETFSRQSVKELSAAELVYPVFKDRFRYRPGDLRAYALSAKPRLHIFPAWGWVSSILEVERIDEGGREVQLAPTRSASEELRPGNRYFVANIREGLDAPGEWWINAAAGEILWWPREESDTARPTVLPALDRLIEVRGTEGVQIRGLEFRDTGYSLEIGVYSPEDAAIHLDGARKCVVEGCRFLGLGGYALRIAGAASGNEFVGNEVGRAGQGGVVLTGGGPPAQPADNLVAGNWFHQLGLVYKHVAAVYGLSAGRTRVAHNLMEDCSRYGISLKTGSHGNILEYNDIRRTNLETNDTGAIETLGRDKVDTGNVIQYNRIEDVIGLKTSESGEILTPHMTWGIYLDDYSSGTTVRGNYVRNFDWGGLNVHGGRNNLVEGNVFLDGRQTQFSISPIDDFCRGNRSVGNFFRYSDARAGFYAIHERARSIAENFSEIDRNTLALPAGAAESGSFSPLGNLEDWRAAGFDRNSTVVAPDAPPPSGEWRKAGLDDYPRAWRR